MIENAIERVREIIEATSPAWGDGFVCVDRSTQPFGDLAGWGEGASRAFSVELGPVEDAGEAGCGPGRRARVELVVSVRYRRIAAPSERYGMVASDWVRLRDALEDGPVNWRWAETGILAVEVGALSVSQIFADLAAGATHDAARFSIFLEVDT